MKFIELKLNDWQQFAEINISLKRVTILTGANGSGKTKMLSLFARHRSWSMPSLATPQKDFKTKAMKLALSDTITAMQGAYALIRANLTPLGEISGPAEGIAHPWSLPLH